jgi:hypothetical protein
MKLAEALLLRAEYQQKIGILQARILANLKVEESDAPLEDPNALLREACEVNARLCGLVKQINARNMAAALPGGRALAEALADRDALKKERDLLAEVANQAVQKDYRLTHTELKTRVTVPMADLQKRIDALARDYRELDAQIQAANWTTEL